MKKNNKVKVTFDNRYDVLYLGFSDRKNSYGDEDDNGIITLKDMTTNAVTGLTIMGFMKKQNEKAIKELFQNYGIDVNRDILPRI